MVDRLVRKIGFFHFGHGWNDPLGELTCALKRYSPNDLKNALIVLPEAFNVHQHYYSPIPWNADSTDPIRLQSAICSRFGITLVAGLVLDFRKSTDPPYSYAYLIPPDGMPHLLCRKANRDNTIDRYKPHAEETDSDNVTPYGNVSITALICMDAFEAGQHTPKNAARHERVKRKMEYHRTTGMKPILCMPCHMYERRRNAIAKLWPGCFLIVANSSEYPQEPGSFVAEVGVDGNPLYCHAQAAGDQNIVHLADLDFAYSQQNTN